MTIKKKELKILTIDDNPEDRELYRRFLRKFFMVNFDVLECGTGQEGLQMLKKVKPDCILLDFMLPDMDGIDFLSSLNTHGFPGSIIMLTGQGSETVAVEALKKGAHDYLIKDKFSAKELSDTILDAVNSNQIDETKKWKTQALVDSLTQVLNRTAYNLNIEQMIRDYQRFKDPTILAIADIDFFKKFNDRYGHKCGDQILRSVASSINGSVRASDIVYRYSGEEFVIILKKTELDRAEKIIENIRMQVVQNFSEQNGGKRNVTISLGLTEFKEDDTEQSVFNRADQALFQAKKNGRNQVKVCQD